ncbi:MAG: dihydroorotase family protein [Candidatus Bathyarchaeia archaeon]
MIVDLILNNAKAYMDGKIVECSLAINEGKIFKIGKEANLPKAQTKIDLKNLLVLPGLIDIHVHLRDEGKAYKEDFYTGTAAAAAGGITTVLDMPNNDPVTMNVKTLKNRMEIAEKKILVNVGFYSEFPRNLEEIKSIIEGGAVAFKLFMAEQVGGLNIDDDRALFEAFKIVGDLKVPVAVHAEDRMVLRKIVEELRNAKRNDIEAYLMAHSEEVELKAVERLLSLMDKANVHIHFCHISTKHSLEALIHGKKSGMPITCETTPHHLFLSIEDLKLKGAFALTTPPIREKSHALALMDGIRRGWIDAVASDHAPHALQEKEAESIWGVKVGISGIETILPLLLNAVKMGLLSIADVVKLMAEGPTRIFKLKGKGFLREGNSADITVVDLDRKYKIDASKFHSKAKYSPFDQWVVEGKPVKTFVGGQLVMDEGEIVAKAGSGGIIWREKV